MGIAFFSVAGLLSPLQAALTWLSELGERRRPAPASPRATISELRLRSLFMPAPLAPIRCARPGWSRGPAESHPGRRPTLRVLRVVDGHHLRASAGRMVISGRMADVCAELDRLAASEPLRH